MEHIRLLILYNTFIYISGSLIYARNVEPSDSKNELKCGEFVVIQDSSNCKRFYKCVNGIVRHEVCPGTTEFSSVYKWCLPPELAKCRPTPQCDCILLQTMTPPPSNQVNKNQELVIPNAEGDTSSVSGLTMTTTKYIENELTKTEKKRVTIPNSNPLIETKPINVLSEDSPFQSSNEDTTITNLLLPEDSNSLHSIAIASIHPSSNGNTETPFKSTQSTEITTGSSVVPKKKKSFETLTELTSPNIKLSTSTITPPSTPPCKKMLTLACACDKLLYFVDCSDLTPGSIILTLCKESVSKKCGSNIPITTEQLTDKQKCVDGIYPDYAQCEFFFECRSGWIYHQQCPKDTKFSLITFTCLPSKLAICASVALEYNSPANEVKKVLTSTTESLNGSSKVNTILPNHRDTLAGNNINVSEAIPNYFINANQSPLVTKILSISSPFTTVLPLPSIFPSRTSTSSSLQFTGNPIETLSSEIPNNLTEENPLETGTTLTSIFNVSSESLLITPLTKNCKNPLSMVCICKTIITLFDCSVLEPNNIIFSFCEKSISIKCGTNTTTATEKAPTLNQTRCVEGVRYPDHTQCKYYFECREGQLYHKKCPKDTKFSTLMLICLPTLFVNCESKYFKDNPNSTKHNLTYTNQYVPSKNDIFISSISKIKLPIMDITSKPVPSIDSEHSIPSSNRENRPMLIYPITILTTELKSQNYTEPSNISQDSFKWNTTSSESSEDAFQITDHGLFIKPNASDTTEEMSSYTANPPLLNIQITNNAIKSLTIPQVTMLPSTKGSSETYTDSTDVGTTSKYISSSRIFNLSPDDSEYSTFTTQPPIPTYKNKTSVSPSTSSKARKPILFTLSSYTLPSDFASSIEPPDLTELIQDDRFTCKENELYSFPGECKYYYECTNGRLILKPCLRIQDYQFEKWCVSPVIWHCSNVSIGTNTTPENREINDENSTEEHSTHISPIANPSGLDQTSTSKPSVTHIIVPSPSFDSGFIAGFTNTEDHSLSSDSSTVDSIGTNIYTSNGYLTSTEALTDLSTIRILTSEALETKFTTPGSLTEKITNEPLPPFETSTVAELGSNGKPALVSLSSIKLEFMNSSTSVEATNNYVDTPTISAFTGLNIAPLDVKKITTEKQLTSFETSSAPELGSNGIPALVSLPSINLNSSKPVEATNHHIDTPTSLASTEFNIAHLDVQEITTQKQLAPFVTSSPPELESNGTPTLLSLPSINLNSSTSVQVANNNMDTPTISAFTGLTISPLDVNEITSQKQLAPFETSSAPKLEGNGILALVSLSSINLNVSTTAKATNNYTDTPTISASTKLNISPLDIKKITTQQLACNESKIFPIPGECRFYQQCVNGRLIYQKCDFVLDFGSSNKWCLKPIWLKCLRNTTKQSSVETKPTLKDIVGSETTNTTAEGALSACIENDVYPNPFDCNKYYVCKSGQLHSKNCPIFMSFSLIAHECLPSFMVHCLNVTTVDVFCATPSSVPSPTDDQDQVASTDNSVPPPNTDADIKSFIQGEFVMVGPTSLKPLKDNFEQSIDQPTLKNLSLVTISTDTGKGSGVKSPDIQPIGVIHVNSKPNLSADKPKTFNIFVIKKHPNDNFSEAKPQTETPLENTISTSLVTGHSESLFSQPSDEESVHLTPEVINESTTESDKELSSTDTSTTRSTTKHSLAELMKILGIILCDDKTAENSDGVGCTKCFLCKDQEMITRSGGPNLEEIKETA